MNNFVRSVALPVLLILLAGSVGCKADFVNKEKPPMIANLVYIPQQAPVEEGNTTSIIGTLDIIEKSGETVSVNFVAYDAGGKEVSSGSIPLSDNELKTSDTLGFGFDMSTAKKGDYTFQVSVTDSKGRQSNKLEGTFKVTDLY